jgi:hypothetical protein
MSVLPLKADIGLMLFRVHLSLGSPKPFLTCPIDTESHDAQHEDREHGEIQQCVNHTLPTHALPLADSDLTPARKIPFGNRHWSGKIKLRAVPVKSAARGGHPQRTSAIRQRTDVRKRARARHVDVNFTRDLDASPAEEWRQEIDQTLFPGGYFKEFIFFHKTSKTLILTDTIINIELDKVTEPWRTATKLTGMYHPFGQIFFGMRLPLLLQRQKAEAAISKIHSWQPLCSASAIVQSSPP